MKRLLLGFIFILLTIFIIYSFSINKMKNLHSMTEHQIIKYAEKNNLEVEIEKEYNSIKKGHVISQSIAPNTKLYKKEKLKVILSLGMIDYSQYKINEAGKVPIMMYHGIVNKKNSETPYTGGNIDQNGYNRTTESFKKDLEFYYKNNYRMIKLKDYITGNIDTELGKSPIILTFDDGLENNIKVTGLDSKGNIIIDKNSAVGILESFKKKYPDFNITASFFVNGSLFNQPQYNNKILKWLIKHNYDVGNHTNNHVDLSKTDTTQTQTEIGQVYQLLKENIPNKYLNIVSLPYGSPYSKSSPNFAYILKGTYNNTKYSTNSTLRVGWEAENSPFSKKFDPIFLKRIRAYDNDGKKYDIEMNFKLLEKNRFISDGLVNRVTIPKVESSIINTTKKVIIY